MFDTLECQYLYKPPEAKVGDFPSPEAFHTVKVERLGGNKVKPFTQVSRRFVVPISALVGDFSINPCEFTHGTPPIVRTFLLSTDGPREGSEVAQGFLQKFWRLYLLARAEGQIGVHTEVYPYAFTCSGHDFFRGAICHNIEVECSDTIPKDLDIADVSLIVAMVMIQDISADKAELLFLCVPLLERETDTAVSKFVSCLELRRAVFTPFFELRGTDTPAASPLLDPIKETLVGNMDTDNHGIKGVTRYPSPVLMCALEQLRQVRLQAIPPRILTIDAVIPILQSKKVVMDIRKVIEHITQTHILRVFAYLIFIGSQDVTSYQSLTPFK